MKSLLQDARYSLRQLKESPGFSLTAIISLALGIAATTAVFSVVYAVVMNPYARFLFADSKDLVFAACIFKGPDQPIGDVLMLVFAVVGIVILYR